MYITQVYYSLKASPKLFISPHSIKKNDHTHVTTHNTKIYTKLERKIFYYTEDKSAISVIV